MSSEPAFGSWLKQRRKELGVAQEELAERIGCSAAMLRKLESGERHPSSQVAQLLADYLNIPAQEREAFIVFARTGKAFTSTNSSARSPWSSHSPTTSPSVRTNLPALLTSLIGREFEQERGVSYLLNPDVRLLTLTGAPGIGKTRLGLQVASELATRAADDFPEGVFLVELATLLDPDLVLPTIAQTLGVREMVGQPAVDLLAEYLRDREIVLVLDNFEQVLDAAPALVKLLERCPQLKVLVTSREALHVRGEYRLPVPPLQLPDLSLFAGASGPTGSNPRQARAAAATEAIEELASCASVELFVERARAVSPDFELSAQNAQDVAEVCTRLEGLPLAIELAAARVDHLSPADMRAALNSRLKMLVGGARDMPARQRTLKSAIEWSYDLLNETEQKVFRRLSVFVGGCTIEGANAVCTAPGDMAGNIDLAEVLAALEDKHLVYGMRNAEGQSIPHSGEPRYGMLEMIREYASEKLWANEETERKGENEEGEVISRAHALYFMELAEDVATRLRGAGEGRWLDILEDEHDNFRAALHWAIASSREGQLERQESKDVPPPEEVGLRIATALAEFWFIRGYFREGREVLADVLGMPALSATTAPVLPTSLLAIKTRALTGAARLASEQGDYDVARRYHEQSLAIAQEIGDNTRAAVSLANIGVLAYELADFASARSFLERGLVIHREMGPSQGLALILTNLGLVTFMQGDYASAIYLHQESLAVAKEIGNERVIGLALNNLGMALYGQKDYTTASAMFEESLSVQRELGNKWGIGRALSNLGLVAFMQGDYLSATPLLRQSLDVHREVDNRPSIAEVLHNLGLVELIQGGHADARAKFVEGILIQRQIGDKFGMATNLLGSAGAAAESGEADRAARLLGAASVFFDRLGVALGPEHELLYERTKSLAHVQLGEREYAKALAEGRAMTLEDAVQYALQTQ